MNTCYINGNNQKIIWTWLRVNSRTRIEPAGDFSQVDFQMHMSYLQCCLGKMAPEPPWCWQHSRLPKLSEDSMWELRWQSTSNSDLELGLTTCAPSKFSHWSSKHQHHSVRERSLVRWLGHKGKALWRKLVPFSEEPQSIASPSLSPSPSHMWRYKKLDLPPRRGSSAECDVTSSLILSL